MPYRSDISQRPPRRIRKRLIAAILLSVGLHVVIFSELDILPTSDQAVTLRAVLNTQHTQGMDNEDSTGVSESQPMPDTPEVPPQPEKVTQIPPAEAPPQPPEPPASIAAPVTETALAPALPPAVPVPPSPPVPTPPAPAPEPDPAETITPVAPPKKELAGDIEVFGTPEEAEYFRVLTAHLRARTPPHPPGLKGRVRLQVKIQYGSVITSVEVISSTGDTRLEQWARKVVLGISPVPAVPSGIKQPFYFRPTIEVVGD
ncbi:energy transducer TonB [uncultured Thalassolituus sp.]|uniref:energy transducer TonB family protein n=1 Tax=uncultured Thalassolituus sp. TaxID=285273 RepID=UPI00261CC87A|nr:energy transducer TonB [uncultured Thalassolituus sp.]